MTTAFPASQLIIGVIFALCLVTTGVGALIAVLSVRLIRSVCGLAIASVGLAGLYYFLHSPFLALMEILIYIGAVCVTIVFAIMLAEPDEPTTGRRGLSVLLGGVGLAVAAAIFWALVSLAVRHGWAPPESLLNAGGVADLGRSLLTTYSMAFELISLALLVAILGALAIARTGRTKP